MITELTADDLLQLFPYAKASKAAKYAPFFTEAIQKYQINTPMRIAAFCAQVEVESGSLCYVEEIASGEAYTNRKDLGNTRPEAIEFAKTWGVSTGVFYKGHGLIQITGYDNHIACGKALNLDLAHHPELLTEPRNAVLSAAWYWNIHNCNSLADAELFGSITKKINGGFAGQTQRLTAFIRNKKYFQL